MKPMESDYRNACSAIFKLEDQLVYGSEARRRFFQARVALGNAWDSMQNDLKQAERERIKENTRLARET
jgi:hypothetical protein